MANESQLIHGQENSGDSGLQMEIYSSRDYYDRYFQRATLTEIKVG